MWTTASSSEYESVPKAICTRRLLCGLPLRFLHLALRISMPTTVAPYSAKINPSINDWSNLANIRTQPFTAPLMGTKQSSCRGNKQPIYCQRRIFLVRLKIAVSKTRSRRSLKAPGSGDPKYIRFHYSTTVTFFRHGPRYYPSTYHIHIGSAELTEHSANFVKIHRCPADLCSSRLRLRVFSNNVILNSSPIFTTRCTG